MTELQLYWLNQQEAKAEFAYPFKKRPRFVLEAKAYGANGSNMTDVIGDIENDYSSEEHKYTFQLSPMEYLEPKD